MESFGSCSRSGKAKPLNAALAKYELGEHYSAFKDVSKSIELNPKDGEAYELRGLIYEVLGDLDSACTDWRYALKVGFNNTEGLIFEKCAP